MPDREASVPEFPGETTVLSDTMLSDDHELRRTEARREQGDEEGLGGSNVLEKQFHCLES